MTTKKKKPARNKNLQVTIKAIIVVLRVKKNNKNYFSSLSIPLMRAYTER